VGLASRGQRDMDSGAEAIADKSELATVRRQARTVNLKTLAFAVVVTAVLVALPWFA
jgi:hypothetical protein